MSFQDIIKNSFLEEFSAISVSTALIAIGLSFALSLFISWIYRITYGGVCYSKGFTRCLIMLTMVTTVVILVISSNVVLSLGMVGALSIVRFRTAIKEPTDTAFLFWGIATGIICGAGYIGVSILVTLLLGLVFVAVHAFAKTQKRGSYMIVLRYSKGCEAVKMVEQLPRFVLKNKNLQGDHIELVAEVELTAQALQTVEALSTAEGVQEITIMRSVSGSVL